MKVGPSATSSLVKRTAAGAALSSSSSSGSLRRPRARPNGERTRTSRKPCRAIVVLTDQARSRSRAAMPSSDCPAEADGMKHQIQHECRGLQGAEETSG